MRLEAINSCAIGFDVEGSNLSGVTGNRVDFPEAAFCMARQQFVAEVFEQSSGSRFDMSPSGSDTRHGDGHCERLLRLPDSFRAHCGDLTSPVLSVTCD